MNNAFFTFQLSSYIKLAKKWVNYMIEQWYMYYEVNTVGIVSSENYPQILN